jgi:uncharacterized protein
MNLFVNRTHELASLHSEYQLPRQSLYVLYGRRRLGKTALLRRFAGALPAVYHMADRSTPADAMRFMAQSMALALREPTLASAEYPDWYALFAAFERFCPRERKTVLVLDEYQYLCESQHAMSSILQRWWDGRGESAPPLMGVLCGSLLSMMYRETLDRGSPLYGRRTAQWLLKPLRFGDMAAFFPHADCAERVRLWSLTGGVPYYAHLASPHRSFASALRSCVLSRDGVLHSEARFLLSEGVTTVGTYWSALLAIAAGACRISELAGRIGLPANQLTTYLQGLRELGFIRREVPVTEPRPEHSKRGLHVLDDPFLRLWFRCVAPLESMLEFGTVAQAEKLMATSLTHHQAWAFESVCRQYVEDRAAEIGAVSVGRHWDHSCELDVVAVDEKRQPVLAGECKWSSGQLGLDAAQRLSQAVATLWPKRAGSIRLALFCISGFTPAVKAWAKKTNALLVGAKELA